MTGFFDELGKRLAEKWLTLLVLPGLLFAATAAAGLLAGHRHALNVGRLVHRGNVLAHELQAAGTTAIVLAASVSLLCAAACGVLARAAGSIVGRCWLGIWPPPFARLGTVIVGRRGRRWEELSKESEKVGNADPERRDELATSRLRISGAKPQRPTWMGDRLCTVDAVIFSEYGLALRSAWPRLWLLASPDSRSEVQAAQAAFDRAVALGGWGVLYLSISAWWWPAVIVAVLVSVTAWSQARRRIDAYADLVEAFVDLHFGPLAAALDIPGPGPGDEMTRTGRLINSRLWKGR